MSNSAFATVKVPAYKGNYTKGRSSKISEITIHHVAAIVTAQRCGEEFQRVGREGSSHYGIGNDGEIGIYVNECDTAWANSNWESNCRAVSIETSNSSTGGDWPVSNKALNSLILLCADIAKRNGLGKLVPGKNLTWHSMYAATTCPGNYLRSKMEYIAKEANKINEPFNGKLSGTDKSRGSNELIVYYKGLKNNGKTGTNMWGYEVSIDKNGVALENPHYSGNTSIPAGGKVLSGHGEAGTWVKNNIRKGYLVWFSDGKTCIAKNVHRSVDVVNGARGSNQLVVYNKGSKATTNKWGYEVAIGKDGKATSNPVYGVGSMSIPTGGFVISGHGEAGTWIYSNIKKGKTVLFNGKYIAIKY